MKLNLITVSLATLVAAGAFPAHAGPQAHVVCGYHHTLGDDAIMMFGKANQAMWHDFFGNTHTDAVSTYQTLRAQPDTTCDNKADSSAYWAPSMKLPDGEIVNPAYQKTYYQSTNVAQYPLHPFPAGLELLAGDHHGTGPSSAITFLCANGKGYTNKVGEICGLRKAGDAVQFNIGIAFPNCWDGVNLKPTHSHNNAIYADHGKCSADYPVKIPTVNMNIAWVLVLPQISSLDTSKVELSMDSVMHGETREERWGSLYTAHADFMNGWTEDGAQFMTDLCMNQGLDCGTTVPYAYSKAEENTWVSSEDDKPHASVDTLYVQDDWTNGGRTQHPETLTLVKFKIPPLPANMDASLFKYRIRLFGGKTEANGADQIFFYPTSSDWHVSTVSWNNKPAINYRSDAVLYLDHSHEYRMVDVDKAVRKALAEGKTEISWYIGGDRQGNHYDFTPADSKQSLVLMLTGFKKTPEL
ncbi:DUF1996 domain-containing protein [Salmonella enterica subsp. enterica serovar Norwich]|nr:DUF1996 domain-containing protein [Salmonella enterica]EDR0139347.1 DUF1996 domain-containing protein [Salmonella enterica subsp. enterica serovar Norwich]EAR2080022.1 DUF1996 domain-containing protein [Salmonella enterica]EAS5796047.1 DUF1996 domain-containing protein [Salmonella enterica]EAT4914816.1 DUF1996 domain-containing protein [Salmonella enterica]